MGLDAVVYVNASNLAFGVKGTDWEIDYLTGEVSTQNLDLSKYYPKELFIDIKKRFGNTSMIGYLREEVKSVMSEDSVILDKILYSGSHSGDVIGREFLNSLEQELEILTARGNQSAQLAKFLEDLSELIESSRRQKNPIVFI